MRGDIEKRGKNSYSIKVSLGKDSTTGKYKRGNLEKEIRRRAPNKTLRAVKNAIKNN
jgi:hypothetical protein